MNSTFVIKYYCVSSQQKGRRKNSMALVWTGDTCTSMCWWGGVRVGGWVGTTLWVGGARLADSFASPSRWWTNGGGRHRLQEDIAIQEYFNYIMIYQYIKRCHIILPAHRQLGQGRRRLQENPSGDHHHIIWSWFFDEPAIYDINPEQWVINRLS